MKASGYYSTIADFEVFISEMTAWTKQLQSVHEQGRELRSKRWFKKSTDVVCDRLLAYKYKDDLDVLNRCWNLCLYHRATDATVINIPEEAAELFFIWFKGRVDVHITKH